MKVIYIQDQEIDLCNNRYYHSKSEHFFSRYLQGLNQNETLDVYAGVVESSANVVEKYKDITHLQIEYKKIPEFRKIQNLLSISNLMCKIVKDADFCYLRTGIAGSLASFTCRKLGIPYMAIVNEDVYNNTRIHKKLIVRLSAYPLLWLNRKMIKNANYACYVTQEYLQKGYPCDGKSLGCSDIEFLDLDEKNLTQRLAKIATLEGKIVLGSVGSVSATLKGQDTVIRALAELKKEGLCNYEYQLVGTGDQTRLRTLAESLGVADRVKFLGAFNHDDVMTWFENIDIYLHPSHSEGLPRTILEAMTKACPCICTSVGGIPELIDKEHLFAYNGNEVADLKRMLLAMDKETMTSQAKINFERSKNYDPKELERKRSEFFKNAIANARTNRNL